MRPKLWNSRSSSVRLMRFAYTHTHTPSLSLVLTRALFYVLALTLTLALSFILPLRWACGDVETNKIKNRHVAKLNWCAHPNPPSKFSRYNLYAAASQREDEVVYSSEETCVGLAKSPALTRSWHYSGRAERPDMGQADGDRSIYLWDTLSLSHTHKHTHTHTHTHTYIH